MKTFQLASFFASLIRNFKRENHFLTINLAALGDGGADVGNEHEVWWLEIDYTDEEKTKTIVYMDSMNSAWVFDARKFEFKFSYTKFRVQRNNS